MKVFFVIALAIAAAHAEPEADPELVYTDGTFHTNLRNLHKGVHNPITYGKVGSVYNSVPSVGYYPSNVYSGIYNPYRLYKREAEAEAEPKADAQYFYNAGLYGRTAYSYPSVYSAGYVRPHAYSSIYNPYRLYKREAEAEAEPEADAQYFYNAGLYGRTAYSYPSVYSAGYVRPHAYSSIYNPYRLYKREAEAEAEPEADAQYLYNAGLYGRTAYAYPSVYRTSAYTYPYNTYRAGLYY